MYILRMSKRFFIITILLLLCQDFVWAQRRAQEDDSEARRQWEEDQRADEYALNLRRRDWLKDRLILELGLGTKFPVMGANWLGLGAGVEYITRWHLSGFVTAGFVPQHSDPVMPGTLEGGVGWRLGLAYYMFEKSPIHLGFQVSYGTVFYDHRVAPEDFDPETFNPADFYDGNLVYPMIMCRGYEFDIFVSYLSDQWLFGQIMIGMYYVGEGRRYQDYLGEARDNKDGSSGWGMTNPSWEVKIDPITGTPVGVVSVVTQTDKHPAIPPYGVVFGVGIGFAFEEFFPDDTEIRRREREDMRSGRQSVSRSSSTAAKKPLKSSRPAPKKSSRVAEDFDEDEEEEDE